MTLIYNVAFTGTTSGNIGSSSRVRYGIVFETGSALIGGSIAIWTNQLKKVAGATGTIVANIYNTSNTLVATANESFDASTLSTSYGTTYTWTFPTPRTIAAGDHLVIEYSGATNINIMIHNTDQYDTGLTRRTSWSGVAWVSSSTDEIDGTIDNTPALTRISLSQTYKNQILNRVSLSQIYKNKILSRVSLSRIYKNKILQRITLPRIYKNKILQRVSLSRIYINKILESPVTAGSFSPISFTDSFTGGRRVITVTPSTGPKKRNKFRNWIASWAKPLREFFKIKQREEQPEPEDVPIPTPQATKIFHILPEPPTLSTKLETLNDKWSVVASVNESAILHNDQVYPLILNPLTAPLIQKRIALPTTTPLFQKLIEIPSTTKADGSHIESIAGAQKKPKNRSKAASTINTLMILLEIESKI